MTGRFGVLMIKMALYETTAGAYADFPSICYSDPIDVALAEADQAVADEMASY